MKKLKLFILPFVLMFVGILNINAKEVTVCKSGCDYTTLQDAVGKIQSGDTVKLKNDVNLDSTVVLRSDMILDLGGYTLQTNTYFVDVESDITITNGTLDLKDSGMLVVQSSDSIKAKKSHLLLDKSLNINADEDAIVIMPSGYAVYNAVVDIKGKVIANGFAITIHGDQKFIGSLAPIVNIYDGAVLTSRTSPAIYAAGYGTWNINGGTITGSEALSIKSGIFNITGGKFTSNGKFVDPAIAYNNGSEDTGAALSITANDAYSKNVKVNITGGTFKSTNGHAFYEGISNSKTTAVKELKISNGIFTSAQGKDAVKITSTSDLKGFITGGTYSSDVVDLVADKYTVNKKSGQYLVEENKIVESNNKDVKFESKDAFSNDYKLVVTAKNKEEINKIAEKVKNIYSKNSKVKNANLLALYEIDITDGNNIIPMNNGKFTISIAIDESLRKYDTYKVIYVNNNGVEETIDAKLIDGKIVFTTSHLSTYGIVGYNNVVVENPNTLDNISLFIVLGSLSLVGVSLSVFKLRKSN